ncbi:MAG TPA: hypothetical protein VHW00_05075 [Thermoanaerobaculia bacterium]|nr:hypothetical protein [Thermoanaerobaculia bacterium]
MADHDRRGTGGSVLRRFPSYDFVLPISLPIPVATARLAALFANTARPKGFVLLDPRVDGTVNGSTFQLRRRAMRGNSAGTPRADGYFVPTAYGADVFVRVSLARWHWVTAALAPLLAVCFLPDALPVFVLLLFLPPLMAASVQGEGIAIRGVLTRLLSV